VNELVQRLLAQERREVEEAARAEIRLLQEFLERATAALEELGARMRDFDQANPGLPDSPHELFRRREEVEDHARALQHETRECQAHLERVREELLRRQGNDEGAERERQELNHEILNAERRLAELAERRADLAKRAETLEALSRRAPELIAQREAMRRELEMTRDSVHAWGERTRAARHELRRIASGAVPPRYRIVEEARPERRPPARREEAIEEAITEDAPVMRTLRDLRELDEDVLALDSLVKGNVRFVQLDANGQPTAVTHFFREAPPEPGQRFVLRVQDGQRGSVALYRLVNLGTGEASEFRDVAARRTPDGAWAIADEGWELITDQLAARMKVKLRPANLGQ
jgi:chromosome segregation ATPase